MKSLPSLCENSEFVAIPPAEAGGYFKSNLCQGKGVFCLEYPQRELGDISDPASAGGFDRQDLNNPPAPAGGIQRNNDGFSRRQDLKYPPASAGGIQYPVAPGSVGSGVRTPTSGDETVDTNQERNTDHDGPSEFDRGW
jgi:hypothetical protein